LIKNKILVVGSNYNICELLIEDTIRKRGNVSWQYENSFSKCNYILETKYYVSNVEFWVYHESELDVESIFEYLGQIVESVIFTFDHEIKGSWDTVLKWFKFAEKYSPSNQVCVCLKDCSSPDKYYDWCSSNFVEFIAGFRDGEDKETREKVGLSRLYETLESVMWENMEMKNNATKPKKIPEISIFDGLEKDERQYLVGENSENRKDIQVISEDIDGGIKIEEKNRKISADYDDSWIDEMKK